MSSQKPWQINAQMNAEIMHIEDSNPCSGSGAADAEQHIATWPHRVNTSPWHWLLLLAAELARHAACVRSDAETRLALRACTACGAASVITTHQSILHLVQQ
jgi:hypothetical protein